MILIWHRYSCYFNTDIDECDLGLHTCVSPFVCVNINGSYNCQCQQGFSSVNNGCQDNDECSASDTNDCSKYAHCINTEGGYICQCLPGYTGNGYTCIGKSV